MVKAVQAHAASLPLPTQEASCCSDLIARVQAVWDAFCALIAAIVDWCATKIHGVGKPMIDIEEPQRERPRIRNHYREWQETLVTQFNDTLARHDRLSGDYESVHFDVNPHLPIEEKMRLIASRIDMADMLCRAANSWYTETLNNKTRLLLDCGANPNKPTESWHYVPLHFAVLSGCWLAYENLREAGANPWIRDCYRYERGNTPIELAYRMVASGLSIRDYFYKGQKDTGLAGFFPASFFSKSDRDMYKIPEDMAHIQRMISYEVERATGFMLASLPIHLDRPVARLITEYYLSGDPDEWGANLVDRYKHFNSLDENSRGVKDQLAANPSATTQERLAMIQKSVATSSELFLAVNPEKTKGKHNPTELFLKLGANPNLRAKLGKLENFTPLHAAVLTRCPLAYKTLRAYGADPTLRTGVAQDGDTCLELAKKMLETTPAKKAHAYFRDFVLSAGVQKIEKRVFDSSYSYNLELFPSTYAYSLLETDYAQDGFGTEDDLQEIIDYGSMPDNPLAQEIRRHYWVPVGLALTIADYAKE